jgi:hypothetical protein
MGLSSRQCPSCHRWVKDPLRETITGRLVCADCAAALTLGSAAGAVTHNVGSGFGVWAMLMRKLRRGRPVARPGDDTPQ